MTRFLAAALPAVALFMLSSCEHKDLCFDHDEHALKYIANVQATYELEWEYTYDGTDWRASWPEAFDMSYESLKPHKPEGLRVVTYNNGLTPEIANRPPEGGEIWFRPGTHSLLFYNNDTEYIIFDDLDRYAYAKATTRSRSRATYAGNKYYSSPSRAENTVNPPDILFAHYIATYTPPHTTDATPLPVTMRPLVFTYLVRYEFSKGLENVTLARGALAGMAEAVYLTSGRTSAEDATILYDCTLKSTGVQAEVRSFGIPDFPNDHYTRSTRRYALNLEVMLKNGKILDFDFDVTDQVAAQPKGGVITVSGIEIPEEALAGEGSGFQVDVSDWGEWQDINLTF